MTLRFQISTVTNRGTGMFAAVLLTLAMLLCRSSRADAGTLIPRDKSAPDPAILSLEEMRVTIAIDNGDAHISIVQIFANHTDKIEEGTYTFALPTGSTVSDFAVWDGPVRIPAVILERKQAEQIYAQAKAQAIDPGLLEAGERAGSDPHESSAFTAKIVPIPAYGTKRLELEYHQRINTIDFMQAFVLPLKPDAGQQQQVRRFTLHFSLVSAHGMSELKTPVAMKLSSNDAHHAEGTWTADNLTLSEDFQAIWQLPPEASDKLEVITHRDPHTPLPTAGSPPPDRSAGIKTDAEPGFFEAQLLVGDEVKAAPTQAQPPRTLMLLFDTSLSMQWDKLERSYAALEATLRSLKPGDQFNLLLFNQAVTPFKPQPVPADVATVAQALDFVRAAKLRGGTDLLRVLQAALAQSAPNTTLALMTDGGSNSGETVVPSKIAARYAVAWKSSAHPPHLAIFAVGDDANLPLLRNLAHQDGFVESVLSTEPVEFHLQSFLSKLTREPLAGLHLTAPASTSLVYPLDDAVYPGGMAQWVGQYRPGVDGTFTVSATRGTQTLNGFVTVPLPAVNAAHPQLPRLWAQARVDALLAQIDRDGESAAAIDEIIRLSRRYKFVTPYTSFLAVPRSLLRPRVIRPGDPVLRVRTDSAIESVVALFPFGLVKPLRHLSTEDLKAGDPDRSNRLWETRFLAPVYMRDGTYNVRLILRDRNGNTYNEHKTFVIASTTPTVKLQLTRRSLHRGEALEIAAGASQSTRTLTAHLPGVMPVTLRWNARAQTNTGTLVVPSSLPVGRYTLTVTAEDVAHNMGSQEVQIDVLP